MARAASPPNKAAARSEPPPSDSGDVGHLRTGQRCDPGDAATLTAQHPDHGHARQRRCEHGQHASQTLPIHRSSHRPQRDQLCADREHGYIVRRHREQSAQGEHAPGPATIVRGRLDQRQRADDRQEHQQRIPADLGGVTRGESVEGEQQDGDRGGGAAVDPRPEQVRRAERERRGEHRQHAKHRVVGMKLRHRPQQHMEQGHVRFTADDEPHERGERQCRQPDRDRLVQPEALRCGPQDDHERDEADHRGVEPGGSEQGIVAPPPAVVAPPRRSRPAAQVTSTS